MTDATIEFGILQHFQLDDNSPKRFGNGVQLARIDRDLTGIKVYRYRDTTLKLHLEIPRGKAPGDLKVQARYVREKEMRDAGAIFSQPLLKPEGQGSDLQYSVLPDEEIELSLSAPNITPAINRVRLEDGETRSLTMTPTFAR